MPRLKYGPITFPDGGYTGTFEHFKEEFEEIWFFAKLEQKARLVELKKAYKIATSKEVADSKAE